VLTTTGKAGIWFLEEDWALEEVIKHEDRLSRAKYLGALADRLFRNECARLGLNAAD